MEDCVNVPLAHDSETPFKTYFRLCCWLVGIFICSVWFWHNISPCRPPLGRCGHATMNGIRTLDLLDEAQIIPEASYYSIICGIIQAELICLDNFFQRCLSNTDKDNKFYLSLHLEGISAMHQFCGTGNGFVNEQTSLSSCWFSLRRRRAECVRPFLESPGGRPQVITDSLFDDLDTGVYRKELCWALREVVICVLGLSRQECGERAAKSLYHLTRNITKMIFTDKCDEILRPDWEDSSLKLMRQSFRSLLSFILRISFAFLIIFTLSYVTCNCVARFRRRINK